jgi:hypothetical protein
MKNRLVGWLLAAFYGIAITGIIGCNPSAEPGFEAETLTKGSVTILSTPENPLLVYSDRNYYFRSSKGLYDSLMRNCAYIRLRNNDKDCTTPQYLSIDSRKPLDVYLLVDKRIADGVFRPDWLKNMGWDSLQDYVYSDARLNTTFRVFVKKNVNSFPFFLGGNKAYADSEHTSSMYELFVGPGRREAQTIDTNTNFTIHGENPADTGNIRLITISMNSHMVWLKNRITGRLGDNENDPKRAFKSTLFAICNANLEGADLADDYMARSDTFAFCNLKGCLLTRAKFPYAYFSNCNLQSTQLNDAAFDSAQFIKCDFGGSDFSGLPLKSVTMSDCNLSGVIFEPENLPKIESLITCRGLDELTFRENPEKGYALAKKFKDAGLKTQYMDVIYALNVYKTGQTNFWARGMRKCIFQWTCEYGRSPLRLLVIWLGEYLAFCGIYVLLYVFVKQTEKSGRERFLFIVRESLVISAKAMFANKFIEELKLTAISGEEHESVGNALPLKFRVAFIIQMIISFFILALFLSIIVKNPFENFLF